MSSRIWTRPIAIVGTALLGAALVGKPVKGQLITTDPYDPYGRPFRSFTYPGANDGPYGPGAGPVRRNPAANQFERATDFLDFNSDLGFRNGRYDSMYRRFDEDFDRNYVPNERADAQYIKDREARERDMIRAMRERDPKKRARLLAEVAEASRKIESDLGPAIRRGASTGAASRAPSPRTARSTSRAPAPRASRSSPPPAPGARSPQAASPAPLPSRARSAPARNPAAARPTTGRRAGAAEEARPTDVLKRSEQMDRAPKPLKSPRRSNPKPGS